MNNQKHNWQKLRDSELDWDIFRQRSRIIKSIRQFFESNGYLEIEAPLLTPYATMDNNIDSVKAALHDPSGQLTDYFLHTSPEHAMKKLLAGGAEKIFFLGKVFRDGEWTRLHNPEFTMLEWYRSGIDYHDIQDETEALICHVVQSILEEKSLTFGNETIDISNPWDRVTLSDLFKEGTGVDLQDCLQLPDMRQCVQSVDVHFEAEDDWESVFFRIFLERVEPGLGIPKPIFVRDYPACMGLMARRKPDDPDWVERVELYMGGLELANGYSELLDPEEQRQRFTSIKREKDAASESVFRLDEELLQALPSIKPCAAGMALGIDRLVMLLLDKTDIQDVLLFPAHAWLHDTKNSDDITLDET